MRTVQEGNWCRVLFGWAVASMAICASLGLATSVSALKQLKVVGHVGGQVNANGTNVCLSTETCSAGLRGSAAGWFFNPISVAVDQETQDIYVADESNQRIEELSAFGAFIRMWGAGVVSGRVSGVGTLTAGSSTIESVSTVSGSFALGQTITGAGIPAGTAISRIESTKLILTNPATTSGTGVALSVAEGAGNVVANEKQIVTISGAPTGGSFTLTFASPNPGGASTTTTNIPYDASATEVQSGLEATASVGPGNVSVTGATGGPWTIEFMGSRYADTNVAQMTTGNALTPSGSVSVSTAQEGASAFEVCTSAAACQAGTTFTPSSSSFFGSAGIMHFPQDVAVDNTCYEEGISGSACTTADPSNGDVYIIDEGNHRIDKFDRTGNFLLMIGGEVNVTKTAAVKAKGGTPSRTELEEENLCVAGESCQAGKSKAYPTNIYGSFSSWQFGLGNLLAVGGPHHLLYVADEGKLQEFNASGLWETELPLTVSSEFNEKEKVTALTIDKSGDVYLSTSYRCGCNKTNLAPGGLHEFSFNKTSGKYEQIGTIDASSHGVEGAAIDPKGRITITDNEPSPLHGVLFSLVSSLSTTFGVEGSASIVGRGLAYDDTSGTLYAVRLPSGIFGNEANVFTLVITPNVVSGNANDVSATSATITGEVQANEESSNLTASGVVEYGRCPTSTTCETSSYGQSTPTVPAQETSETFEPVAAQLTNLFPNQAYHYRVVASNVNGVGQGSERTFTTRHIPPAIESAPDVPFVHSQSAVVGGALNPENAATEYQFQYVSQGAFEATGWAGAQTTPPQSSSVYSTVNTSEELTGLSPSTTYHVRLVANNGESTNGPETTFTTAPAPLPSADTGGYDALTPTSAVISGTVDPEGVPASYAFEVGIYDGAATQFGVVFEGSPGMGDEPVAESLQLTGLQPDTTYAYRVSIKSGYIPGQTAYGATVTFTTPGVPSVIATPPLLAQLPVPPIAFPGAVGVKGKPLTNAQKLKNALKGCHKQRNRRRRLACERRARKRYGPKKKKK